LTNRDQLRNVSLITLNFLINNLDLLLIVFNVFVLSNTLTTESYYVPWRAILTPGLAPHASSSPGFAALRLHYPTLLNQTNAFFKEPDPWLWTAHGGDHAAYAAAGHGFVKLVPEYFDLAGAHCLDQAAASEAWSSLVPPAVAPLDRRRRRDARVQVRGPPGSGGTTAARTGTSPPRRTCATSRRAGCCCSPCSSRRRARCCCSSSPTRARSAAARSTSTCAR
jgi:hypothetical protein